MKNAVCIELSVLLVVMLLAGFLHGDPKQEIHKCTHPSPEEYCPGGSVLKSLHCQACTTACGDAHKEGCICVMDYPCGKEYREDEYCSPIPRY